jgi:hypothetical protein
VVDLANTDLHDLLPTSLTRALYLLTLLTGILIVAMIIRMGRRGGRHTV